MLNIKNQKGFTLVELMVVLLIIGILIAVAIPVFLGARSNAQDNAIKQALTNAGRAAASARAADGDWPISAVLMRLEEDSYDYADNDVTQATGSNYEGTLGVDTTPNGQATDDEFELAGMSVTGTCFWILGDTDGTLGAIQEEATDLVIIAARCP